MAQLTSYGFERGGSCFQRGVFRRSHVTNNPVNNTDAQGTKSFKQEYCETISVNIGFCADVASTYSAMLGQVEVSVAATVVSGANSAIKYKVCGKNTGDVTSAVTAIVSIVGSKLKPIYGIVLSGLSIIQDFSSLPGN